MQVNRTAIQELLDWLNEMPKVPMSRDLMVSKILIALEKEKQQIIESYKDGFEENVRPKHDTAEIYYNEKYQP